MLMVSEHMKRYKVKQYLLTFHPKIKKTFTLHWQDYGGALNAMIYCW